MPDFPLPFSRRDLTHFRRLLQAWFRANQRELPWRRNRDPYAIWVSEVMLQQTQIAAVIPFYLRFMKRFPDISTLAAASEQEVLRQWEGLGYYRRARHLYRAAQVIVNEYGGTFPDQVEAASSLPGLGRYTVGAVLSQAFDRRLPVVDANVARVLCRLGAWREPLEKVQTQAWLWHTAEALLPRQGSGDFNQALMELGQTICVTRQPACLLCPWREVCRGRAKGIATELPVRAARQRLEEVNEFAVIVQRDSQILLVQRQADAARWANMWELPTAVLETTRLTPRYVAQAAARLTGVSVRAAEPFGELRYGVTRFRIHLQGFVAQYTRGSLRSEQYQALRWLDEQQLAAYPLSIPQRRLLKLWRESCLRTHR